MSFDGKSAEHGIGRGGKVNARSGFSFHVQNKVVRQFGGESNRRAVGWQKQRRPAGAEYLRLIDRPVPAAALITPPAVPQITLQTPLQNSLMISDVPGPTGGILIKSTTGAMISVSDTGILISNGQGATILMEGPSVTINEGALEVI